MRVLQVGKFYPPVPGGIETAIRTVSEGLARMGNTVTVLCFSENANRSEEVMNDVRVIRIPTLGTLFSQPLNPLLFTELRKLAQNADIIHLHMPNPLAEAAILALGIVGREVPLVVSYHSDVVRQRALLPLYAPLVQRILKRARRITTASRFLRDDSPALAAFANKCEIIPYGLEEHLFNLTPAIEEKAARLREEHGPFALFVGRLVPYKGVEFLIRAARAAETNVVIAGDGPLRAELVHLAEELGVTDRVRFLGRVDGEQLAALYHACCALTLPSISKTEAFGLVQLEAMGWSKPSVVSRLPSGIVEVNEEGKTAFFVPPGDSGALASAIHQLSHDSELSVRMGKAARRRFEDRFLPGPMIESVLKLYRESTRS